MTEIQDSIKKLREASQNLEKSVSQTDTDDEYVRSLKSALDEINSNMEKLRKGVEQYSNSPIQFRK